MKELPKEYSVQVKNEEEFKELLSFFYQEVDLNGYGYPTDADIDTNGFCRSFGCSEVSIPFDEWKDLVKKPINEKSQEIIMSEPDWKTAPEGATHFFKDLGSFYKKDSGSWFRYNMAVGKWMVSDDAITFCDAFISSPPAWHETGDLPPVGEPFEMRIKGDGKWLRFKLNDRIDGDKEYLLSKFDIRPLQSDKDKAIEQMIEKLGFDENKQYTVKEICSLIYDKGLTQ